LIKIRKTLVTVFLFMHLVLFLLHFMSQMGCSRTRPLNIYNTAPKTDKWLSWRINSELTEQRHSDS